MTLREDYNRDGYVVTSTGIDVDKALREISCLFKVPLSNQHDVLFLAVKSLFSDDIDKYVTTLRACAKLMSVQEIFIKCKSVTHDLGIELPLLISPVVHVVSDDLKIPDGYHGAFPHQDWPSLQGSLNVITIWIPFMDVGIENFTLEVVPGSHLEGFKDGETDGSVLKIPCDESKFVPLSIKKGDVLFMSGFLVHQTKKEGCGFRLAVSQRFEDASDPAFIERGYPCAQKRVVDREIKWKPTIEEVQKVFS